MYCLCITRRPIFERKRINEKLSGEYDHKPPDCATKETSDTDVCLCPPQKQKAILSPFNIFYFVSLSPPCSVSSLSVLCMRSGVFVTVCVYFRDWLGLICTTAVEGKGAAHTATHIAEFDTNWYYHASVGTSICSSIDSCLKSTLT